MALGAAWSLGLGAAILGAILVHVASVLDGVDGEWQVSDRRYFSAGSMAKVDALEGGEDPKELLAQIA